MILNSEYDIISAGKPRLGGLSLFKEGKTLHKMCFKSIKERRVIT